ncbi:MAG: nucleotidyltransferase family protein [Bacteroidales bacterium]|nr:nucleotidyltransferase family protein [Bacteroidales bacterium]
MNAFFELIAIAQGRRDSFSEPLGEERWKEVTLTAFKQSLGGVLAEAFYDRLPAEQFPSHQVFMAWMCMQKQVALDNHILDERSAEVYRIFREAGFDCCILKGQAVARFYPKPEERQSGDVDIWVDGDRDRILAFLRERWEVENVVYHHAEVRMFEKTEVEVHFMPSWMYNPRINRRLQKWFEGRKAAQFANMLEERGFAAPTAEFDAVFSMVHVYRHLLEEGVGLRQVMDYYYILHQLDEAARKEAFDTLCSLRMRRFAGALMYVEEEVFGLERELMVCPPDEKAGKFLLGEIMTAGNFGQYDPRYAKVAGEGRLRRFARKMWRQARFVAQYPSEVLWFPGYRLWQFIWRKIKKYD